MLGLKRRMLTAGLRVWGEGPARFRSNRIVLCFHNFGDGNAEDRGYLSSRRCLPISNFRDQMAWLDGVARIVPLSEIQDPSPEKLRVAITIDDGYANNVRLLFPVLESMGIPATWFVSTGFVDNPDLLPWWDLLDFMIERQAGVLDFRDAGIDIVLDLAMPSDGRMADVQVRKILKGATTIKREAMIGCIRNLNPEVEFPHNAFARQDEVVSSLRSGLIEIGGHTITHPNLARCQPEELLREIGGGRDRLSKMCGREPRWFAYPFGGREAISQEASDMLGELGFAGGVSTMNGVADAGNSPFMIPRLTITPRMTMGEFKAILRSARVFSALRTRGRNT